MKTFPPGKLPPSNELTQRPQAEIEAVLKGPFAPGGPEHLQSALAVLKTAMEHG